MNKLINGCKNSSFDDSVFPSNDSNIPFILFSTISVVTWLASKFFNNKCIKDKNLFSFS